MDHIDLIHNAKGVIETAVRFNVPVIGPHAGVGYTILGFPGRIKRTGRHTCVQEKPRNLTSG